ncbi:Seven transmembrane MLO family protein [Perilla frutescens var. frutescens]|nr:Seven transmembrane MLO family protein [Perilla frutescens var. frutescens]
MAQPMAAGWAGASRRMPQQGPHGPDSTVGYPCLARVHLLSSRLVVSATQSIGL